jgi:hypothetical protein
MSLNDVLFVIAVVGLVVTTGLKHWPESRSVRLVYEGENRISDGRTVGEFRFAENPGRMNLPVGLVPEDTDAGETVRVTVEQ